MATTTRQPGRRGDGRDSSIIWFAEECLNNSVSLEGYVRAAERARDPQLADFFRRALAETRRVQDGDPRLGRLRHAAHIAEFGGA
jgi:hypothetical protein